MGFPCHTVFESFMTSPRLLGEAILSVVTGNAAHYLQSLMLHAAVVSIDPAQLDHGYPPQTLGWQEGNVLTLHQIGLQRKT